MSIPLICIGLLAFLLIGVGFSVSLARSKTMTIYSSNNDPEDGLYKLVRAHANTAEYVPLIALLIYILSQTEPASWVLGCMILVTFCRYLVVGIVF